MWLAAPQFCTGVAHMWEGDCPCAYLAEEHLGSDLWAGKALAFGSCELPALLGAYFMYLWQLDRVSCYKLMISSFLQAFFRWSQSSLDALKHAGINTAHRKWGFPFKVSQIPPIQRHEVWEKEEQRLCRCFFRPSFLPTELGVGSVKSHHNTRFSRGKLIN